ncbi:MAG: DUF4962 domain-containing protein [Pirellulales bacterium]|nr:DUF4962 domain-containing protein [Pirellulales bacterium]
MRFLSAVVLMCLESGASSAWELHEQPAEPGEWGFRPSSETDCELNPPAFTWRQDDRATSYRLQVSTDREFRDLAYDAGSQWSSHCPPQILPAGKLFWRYRAVGEDGEASAWSRPRQFTILPDATPYPQPKVEELKSRLPTERPRLFMRPETLARYRQLAESDLGTQWQAIQRSADRLLASPPDLSEPPKYPKGMLRKSGAWKVIWWGNRQRVVAVADGAATLAFAYCITGERRYGEAARDFLVAMTKWDPKGATSFAYNRASAHSWVV